MTKLLLLLAILKANSNLLSLAHKVMTWLENSLFNNLANRK